MIIEFNLQSKSIRNIYCDTAYGEKQQQNEYRSGWGYQAFSVIVKEK